jgi:hypothetical protein
MEVVSIVTVGLGVPCCIGRKEFCCLQSFLPFFSETIVSPAHSSNFPTASGHRQLSFFSKTSILTVFFSIEHMHLFLS